MAEVIWTSTVQGVVYTDGDHIDSDIHESIGNVDPRSDTHFASTYNDDHCKVVELTYNEVVHLIGQGWTVKGSANEGYWLGSCYWSNGWERGANYAPDIIQMYPATKEIWLIYL
jgi:hypothetical protein